MSVELDRVVPWGRSLAEYRGMFALGDDELRWPILGCGDGPASFNAELHELGGRVVSVDPVYRFSAEQIERRVRETYETIVSQVKRRPENYVWDRFHDPDDLGQHRLAAMRRFLTDYEVGRREGRYVAGGLPALPLAGGSFRLALVSHLLFLYAGQLSLEFHVASLKELCRVAGEVRVFPLLDLSCRPSPHVEPVARQLRADGYAVSVGRVAYEFQRGGNEMMRVRGGGDGGGA